LAARRGAGCVCVGPGVQVSSASSAEWVYRGEHIATQCSVAAHLASGARLNFQLRALCRRAGDLLSRGLLRGCQPRPAEGPADGLEATGVATNADGEPLSAVVRPAHTSQERAACACLARLHHAHMAPATRRLTSMRQCRWVMSGLCGKQSALDVHGRARLGHLAKMHHSLRRQSRAWMSPSAASQARTRPARCRARATWTATCAPWLLRSRWLSARRRPWCCRAERRRRAAPHRACVRTLLCCLQAWG